MPKILKTFHNKSMEIPYSSHSRNYRIELDGMRGLAIISGIWFHISQNFIPGTYSAISMFFVLSGYLITSSISSQYDNGTFSFKKFYSHRISRLIPTFYSALLVTLLFGCMILLPRDLYELADSARNAISFFANQYFANAFNYFYHSSQTKPLLHTWSLSVEEQFYFVFPTTLLVLSKFLPKKRYIIAILFLLSCSSFIFAEYLSRVEGLKTISNYILAARMGEFLLGCILGLSEKKILETHFKKIRYLAELGLVLLLVGYFLLDTSSIYPGFNSLWPAGAAVLLILGMNHPESLAKRIFSLKPLVYAGVISYSLFLWHFPVLAFSRYLYLGIENGFVINMALILVIWAISHCSWKWIENPLRYKKRSFKQNFLLVWLAPGIVLILICQLLIHSDGWTSRSKKFPELATEPRQYVMEDFCAQKITDNCFLNKPENPSKKVILFGDSHAAHYMSFWKTVAEKYNMTILAVSSGDCFPSLNEGSEVKIYGEFADSSCKEARDYIYNKVSDYDEVILGGAWSTYIQNTGEKKIAEDFQRTLKFLERTGKKVLVMEEIPIFKNYEILHYLATQFAVIPLPWSLEHMEERLNAAQARQDNAAGNEWLKKETKNFANVIYIDLSKLSPIFQGLPVYQSEMLYADGKHLNTRGSKLLAEDLLTHKRRELDQILKP